jgi:hypothetical protein
LSAAATPELIHTGAGLSSTKIRRIPSVTLAARMAYPNYQTERFLALNGLASNATLTSGQKVKIVTY